MKIAVRLTPLVVLITACIMPPMGSAQTTTGVAAPAPATNLYAGEVWTWDEQTNIVTLRRGWQTIRVRVAPEELRSLQLHQFATVRGELAPPAELPRVLVTPGPVNAVPRGTPQQTELNGTVAAATPDGRLSLTTDRGPLHVWVASGVDQRLPAGTPVHIAISVQPVDYVPASSAPASSPEPSASVANQPSDSSVVTGRVLGVDPRGSLVVESPAGPIQVAVSDPSAFKVAQPVQVRTTVSKAG